MSSPVAPEPVRRAAIRVSHVAVSAIYNWELSEDPPRKQIDALLKAVHEILDLIKRWRGDERSLRELRMYLQGYDDRWSSPKLEQIFNRALNDPSL